MGPNDTSSIRGGFQVSKSVVKTLEYSTVRDASRVSRVCTHSTVRTRIVRVSDLSFEVVLPRSRTISTLVSLVVVSLGSVTETTLTTPP